METAPPSSQPMPPHTDLLGTRLRRTTAEGAEDVLEVRNDLSATGSFEFPLRERVLRLAGFHHRSFVQVHRVERAPGRHGALAIVSDAADGVLLSDILASAADRGPAIPAPWALDIVRQLLDSLSAMHAIARDVGHGALTPSRILIGSGGEALIRDYVFGGALEQLGYSNEQYWTELGVPTAPEAPGIDQRLDLFQIGLTGLQLLGERVSQPTLARAGRQRAVSALAASGEAGPLVADARRWLARALQLDAPFTSALDARKDLESLLARHASISARVTDTAEWLRAVALPDGVIGDASHTAPADRPLSKPPFPMAPVVSIDSHEADAPSAAADDNGVDFSQRRLRQPTTPVASPMVDAPRVTMPALVAAKVTPAPASSRRTLSRVYPALGLVALIVAAVVALYVPINGHDTGSTAGTSTLATSAHDGPAARDAQTHATTGSLSDPAGDRRISDRGGDANASAAAGADGGGSDASQSPRYGGATGTLQVRTQPAGAQVWVDGIKAGRSPVTLNVATGEHRIEISSDGAPVKDVVTVQRDATTSVIIPLPAAPRAEPVAAAPRAEAATAAAAAGWIGIASPIDVEIFEGDQLIGTRETRRLMLPAGTHQLDIVNHDLGYASRRIVNVTPNKLTPLKVELSPGTLAINALPWAEVSLDGQSLGATPIGNVKASVGTHEVVFRHPKLGEQRRTVVVPLSGIARISVDMGAK
jgi:hypothetical protein